MTIRSNPLSPKIRGSKLVASATRSMAGDLPRRLSLAAAEASISAEMSRPKSRARGKHAPMSARLRPVPQPTSSTVVPGLAFSSRISVSRPKR
ncbi:hypothetical protein D3C87_1784880 [compost metagenome]